ncbi:Coenzyme F420 hydrogenase/dehydrogenase, beta subunit C-terminal domain [Ligilactobacillus equi]|uniref:Coenzyme F420 hydrogenase dehydrogenase subunit beta domain protein n=1 Tax=Ligilactobacillus equi DSM 15833 = JCM 10991 TaxID=1423740 RepID=A0A0R1TM91_9LACO|nr:Coenzyme F420 hydrogenase/dehydrogenase, beta subunit C-terminal domain [Ligilactobacillus equi]KRL79699.1 coenzyme F420 hydrogenase dehydrogenase subunit beta domain protein [Ligilactobacillus equi DSM 15833 = JCM 10991]
MDIKKIDNRLKSYNEASGVISYYNNSKIKLNEYGEYEEKIDNTTILNGISPNYTDITNEDEISKELYGNLDGIFYDKRIGYYKSLYVGHVAEGNYRKNASSGGVGTWIFKELFERNLIDGVIHVKQTSGDVDKLFSYQISKSIEEIQDGAKTKYYPVELSEVLEIVRNTPGRYAIIGIPSFIYALRLLSKKDAIIGERIKYMIGLICGHQKSSTFADFMGWQLGFKPGNMTYINFRKKLPGRRSSDYGIEVHGYIDGKYTEKISPTSELLGQDWGQGWFRVFASDYTDDVFNETADLVLGDAWLPGYTDDSDGNNVVIVRNEAIDEIIKESLKNGNLNFDDTDADTIFKSQSSGYRHLYQELPYRLYKRDKEEMKRPKKRVEASEDIQPKRRKIQDIREDISINSHIYFKEAVEKGDLQYFIDKMMPLSNQYYQLYRKTLLRRVMGKLKRVLSSRKIL